MLSQAKVALRPGYQMQSAEEINTLGSDDRLASDRNDIFERNPLPQAMATEPENNRMAVNRSFFAVSLNQ
jgi:hypothetical protein